MLSGIFANNYTSCLSRSNMSTVTIGQAVLPDLEAHARVSLGFQLQELLDLGRNPYDKIGHFFQGFVPALAAREILLRGCYAGTPLLSIGGIFAKDRVIEYFREHAANMDTRVATFVLQRLMEFPHGSAGGRDGKFAIIGALVCGLLIAWRILR